LGFAGTKQSVRSIPIAGYCSVERLVVIYCSFAQQARKITGIGVRVRKINSLKIWKKKSSSD